MEKLHKCKYLSVKEKEELNLDTFPSWNTKLYSVQDVRDWVSKFNKNPYLVKCGGYIYDVSTCKDIWEMLD